MWNLAVGRRERSELVSQPVPLPKQGQSVVVYCRCQQKAKNTSGNKYRRDQGERSCLVALRQSVRHEHQPSSLDPILKDLGEAGLIRNSCGDTNPFWRWIVLWTMLHDNTVANCMATCATCKEQLSDSAVYCPRCASIREPQSRFSYAASILFGFGLLLLVLIWKLATMSSAPNVNSPQVAPKLLDEPAGLITSCGTPDVDKTISQNPAQQPNRVLIYRKAGVKVTFGRPNPSARWMLKSAIDQKTTKPLTNEKLLKRLPCADALPELRGAIPTPSQRPER
jgi:hypothetical protein